MIDIYTKSTYKNKELIRRPYTSITNCSYTGKHGSGQHVIWLAMSSNTTIIRKFAYTAMTYISRKILSFYKTINHIILPIPQSGFDLPRRLQNFPHVEFQISRKDYKFSPP